VIFQKSLQDIFSKEVLFFVFKTASLSLILTLFLTWGLGDNLASFIASYLSWIPWEWLQTTGASVMAFAFSYMLFIIFMSIFTALYSEPLLISLAKKHYPHRAVIDSPKISVSLFLTLKSAFWALVLFIVFLPVFFIPILGQVFLVYIWSILLKDASIYDVGTLFVADKQILKNKSKKARLIAMIASLFNLIPFVNIFASVFAQIVFLHYILAND